MEENLLSSTLTLLVGSLFAADSTPKDDVLAAAKKLGAWANSSWKQAVVVPEDAQFKPGPTAGKTITGGVTYVTFSFGDIPTQIYLNGTN